MNWNFDDSPPKDSPGWYAVLVCFDPREGVFPDAAEWDGEKWKHKAIVAFGDRKETPEEAREIAYENDF